MKRSICMLALLALMAAACGRTGEEAVEIPVQILESSWLVDFQSVATQVRWNPDFDSTAAETQEWEFFRLPRIIVLSPFGDLVISDTGNARVVRVSQCGDLVEIIGRPGDGPGEFREPSELGFVPGTSELWVGDRRNARILRFHLTEESSTFLGNLPAPQIMSGGINQAIAPNDDRSYWVGSANPGGRIRLIDDEGVEVRAFGELLDVFPPHIPVHGGQVCFSLERGEVYFAGRILPILERWSKDGTRLAYRDPIYPGGLSTSDLRISESSDRMKVFTNFIVFDEHTDQVYVMQARINERVFYSFNAATLDAVNRYESPSIGHWMSMSFAVATDDVHPKFYLPDYTGRGIEKLEYANVMTSVVTCATTNKSKE